MGLYTTIHLHNVPGHAALKRGELSAVQIGSRSCCPGNRLALCAQQTDDPMFTSHDCSARTRGMNPSGLALRPRPNTGSFVRSVRYLRKVSGERFRPGGIACGADLFVYPDKD